MIKKFVSVIRALLLPAIVWIVFVILTKGKFASPDIFLSILRTAIVPMIMAMALAIGMSMGMINFAIGAVAYASTIFAMQISQNLGWGIPGICVITILISLVLCTAMGAAYNLLRIPCLILSLGFAMIFEAMPLIFTKTGVGTINLFDGYLGSSPWCYVILGIMFAIFYVINDHLTIGANMRAIGANITIANNSGINIDKVKFASFVLTGLFTGVAAIVFLSQNVKVTGSVGFGTVGMIFDGLMGVFIAFVMAKNINYNVAVLIGAFTIRMLSTGLVTCGYSSEVRGALTGVFLFAVVAYSANANVIQKRNSRRRVAEAALTARKAAE